jgi:hypothetical protein
LKKRFTLVVKNKDTVVASKMIDNLMEAMNIINFHIAATSDSLSFSIVEKDQCDAPINDYRTYSQYAYERIDVLEELPENG